MSYIPYQPTEALKIADGVYKTKISGLNYLTFPMFGDDRGVFTSFHKIPKLNPILGTDFVVKQLNYAYSIPNVIRGMHGEAWNKLITVLSGKALCVLADIRPNSPTFLKTEYFEFEFDPKAKTLSGLYITQGIANSICVLKGPVGYLYAVDQLYEDRDVKGDQAISVFDPDLAIDWPLSKDQAVISERDTKAITVRELFPEKFQA